MPRSPLPRALLALVAAALLATAGELVLWALGAVPSGARDQRGFDPGAAYLIPDPSVPGGYRTQMFASEAEEIRIPPKGGARRVLLFGGSNTQGFPGFVLEARLESELPGTDFEVINLGRKGYGSGRVSILLEQALQLEPDLLVVYSGHNEFVEAGFEAELKEARGGLLGFATGTANRLGTYRWMRAQLARDGTPTPPAASQPRPEQWRAEFERFSELTYGETLERFRRYESNLERMAAAARARGVAIVFCTVISNPLAPPFASTPDPAVTREQRSALWSKDAEGVRALPERFQPLAAATPQRRVHATDFERRTRELDSDAAPPPARPHGGRLAAVAALWPPLDQWSPRAHVTLGLWAELLTGAFDPAETAQFAAALDHFDRALQVAEDVPLVHFHRAIALLGLGRRGEARLAFETAARLDRAPRKGNSVSNDAVRRVAARAAARQDARLFDAAALFEQRAPDGILGYETMKDECHLHVLGAAALMYDLAEFLAGRDPLVEERKP